MLATVGGSLSPSNDIVTGTNIAGDTSNWAMKLVPVEGTYKPTILSAPNITGGADASFSEYHTVPEEYTKVATLASNTDFTVGSAFQTTYRAYISPTQLAGSYQGKVRYTLVHPASETPVNNPTNCPAGHICYNPNAEGVVDSMGDQTLVADFEALGQYAQDCRDAGGAVDVDEYFNNGNLICNDTNNGGTIDIAIPTSTTATLWASNFRRSGYGFAGWRDESGNRYGPNETIDIGTMNLSNEGLSLYAIWVKSEGNIQNWTGCSSLGINQVTALTDTRDNDTYAVAKLADGKCWMIENLRLGGETAMMLMPTDSDVITNFVLSASTDPMDWCMISDAACIDQPMLNSTNTISPVANMTSPYASVYSYGNYYNWYSAVAGTRSLDDGEGNAIGSICPKGWKLPTGWIWDSSGYGDFYRMVSTVSGKTLDFSNDEYSWGGSEAKIVREALQSYPNNWIASGVAPSGNYGLVGAFWSSTADGANGARIFAFSSVENEVLSAVGTGNGRMFGQTVRCMFGL